MTTQGSILGLRENFSSWCLYVVIMGLLTYASFGNLSTHLLSGEDSVYIQDAAVSQQDIAFILSPQRALPGRPTFNLYLWTAYKLFNSDPAGYHLLQVWLHLLASLLAAFTFRKLGGGFELSLVGGLLFLMNVAHFRAVHWISATSYIWALIFGLGTVLLFCRRLETGRHLWTLGAALLLAAAMCAHPSAAIIALLCLLLALQKRLTIWRAVCICLPLFVAALVSGTVVLVVYSGSPLVGPFVKAPELLIVTRNLFWLWGRLITTAHWLPEFILLEEYTYWELAAGFILLTASLFLAVRRGSLPLFWTVWAVAFSTPFITSQILGNASGPSRYLYFSSLGTSFVFAWALCTVAIRVQGLPMNILRVVFSGTLSIVVLSSYLALGNAEAVSLYHSGRTYAAESNNEEAVKQFKRAIKQGGWVLPLDVYRRLAHSAFALGESIEPILKGASTKHPTSAELEVLLGISAFLHENLHIRREGEKRIQKALETSENDKQLRHDTAVAFNNLAAFYLDAGDYQTAIHLSYRALTHNSNYPPAMINLASALLRNGETEKSIGIFETALRLEPSDWKARVGLAQGYEKLGRIGDAIIEYQRAVSFNPNIREVHYNLGVHHFGRGEFEEAAEAFHQALRLSPRRVVAVNLEDSLVYQNLAIALKKTARLEEATQAYRAYLEFQPGNWKAWLSLAQSYETLGKIDDAIRSYEHAVSLNPKFVEAHFNLGVHNFKRGKFQQAAESFRRAVQLSPDFLEARLGLAKSYEKIGQRELTIQQYRHALALDPNNDIAKAHLQALLDHEPSK